MKKEILKLCANISVTLVLLSVIIFGIIGFISLF